MSATAGRLVITGKERVKDSGEGQMAKKSSGSQFARNNDINARNTRNNDRRPKAKCLNVFYPVIANLQNMMIPDKFLTICPSHPSILSSECHSTESMWGVKRHVHGKNVFSTSFSVVCVLIFDSTFAFPNN